MPRLIGLVAVALLVSLPAGADPICSHTTKAHACRFDDGTVAWKVGNGPWVSHRPVTLPEADPLTPPTASVDVVASEVAVDATVIDVGIAATQASVTLLGGPDAFQATARLIIDTTNRAFDNSLIPGVRVRLVGTRIFASAGSAGIVGDLNWIVANGAAWRNSIGADQVQIITESGDACGVGFLGPDIGYAYSVVYRPCIGGLSASHELGHNYGMAHDPAAGGYGWFAYSHGYVDPQCRFRDAMSYGPCPRVPYYSSPLVFLNGAVTGTAMQDNRLTLINTAAKVAAFRPSAFTTQAAGGFSSVADDAVPASSSLLLLLGLCLAWGRRCHL